MASRTKNAFLNISSNLIVQILKTVLNFITRTIFIYCLGKEALGLNGLFTNILSMLSIAELGMGTAINFSLYEPLAKKDKYKISSLMSFYRKAYRTIGFVVAILGILLIPFLKYLITDINSIKDVYIIYLLYLANTVSTYFISYKETLINADQKNYKLTKINTIFLILLNIFQIIILLIFKSFILYLEIQFIVQFVQRVVTNAYVTREYKNINFKTKQKVGETELKIIVKNVKAMFFHKIGEYCINSTDNLIISAFINISTVGLYSNYLTVFSLLNSFIIMFFNNLTSSLGNLLVTESNEKKCEIYKKMDFIGFLMYGSCSVILINVFNDLITFWIGNEYCIDFLVVLAMVISFYITGMRVAPATIKSSAGLYDIDKFTPIIQSIVNLIVSIVLVQYIGLLGVIIGTIVSSLIVPSWQRPYIVYKHILNKPFKEYISSYLKRLLLLSIIISLSLVINRFIILNNSFLLFVVKSFITLIIYSIFIVIVYIKADEFNYILLMIKKIIRRIKNEKRFS